MFVLIAESLIADSKNKTAFDLLIGSLFKTQIDGLTIQKRMRINAFGRNKLIIYKCIKLLALDVTHTGIQKKLSHRCGAFL